jgi:NADPH2:quinone reductase
MYEPERIPQTFDALFELHRQGKIAPVIWKTFPLDQLPAALEALGSRQSWGKVIVTPEAS